MYSFILFAIILPEIQNFVYNSTQIDNYAFDEDRNTTALPEKISFLLDELLQDYDINLRPNIGIGALRVAVEFNIRSIGPITEQDMIFSMECYFRQRWTDQRLAFNKILRHNRTVSLTLNVKILDRIWHPDSVIVNGQRSYLHNVPVPNRFVRIYADGSIYYSQRLTVRTRCPMILHNFPLDSQSCPLTIGSFAYSSSDVIYEWSKGKDNSVEIAKDMKLSQFDLIGHRGFNSRTTISGVNFSVLEVQFMLKRRTGYFMIQVYLPCALLVILSWVSFWINREAASDRISLGVTTVLTMTFLGIDNRVDLPKVAYSTALDVYLVFCFTFVLATIIQFAVVHRFHRHLPSYWKTGDLNLRSNNTRDNFSTDESDQNDAASSCKAYAKDSSDEATTEADVFTISSYYKHDSGSRNNSKRRKLNREIGVLRKVSVIDKASRIIFPLLFCVFNTVYWIAYLDVTV